MGRPKEHDQETRAASERRRRESSPVWIGAFSVRAVAREVGTTTRAVYSLFGSKEGLLVDALAQSAFEFLTDGIAELPETEDVVADLVAVGVPSFARSCSSTRPSIESRFSASRRTSRPDPRSSRRASELSPACWERSSGSQRPIFSGRKRCSKRLEFNAMLEGLANAELRGTILRILPAGEEERTWQEALTTVARGFRASDWPRLRLTGESRRL